ncbi:hypothetical protein MOQ_001882 [Trypanosoma cruzi marinkellei]|uniref:MI domain-containing protein n=1 Tax=Trypanosoma cruzi marinkellei TaxID=85056 RepID=K2NSD9_TRYCR|nr:hypothetical protein MOQ_001882 [Trypanosoma cruzi marinkellei]
MQASSRRRGRDEGNDEEFDKQRDRKQRRRSDREARKQARILAHEKWVEQRRMMREQMHKAREMKRSLRKETHRKRLATSDASVLPPRRATKVAKSMKTVSGHGKTLVDTSDAGDTHSSLRALASQEEPSPPHEEEQSPMAPTNATTTTTTTTASATETNSAKYIPPTLRGKTTREKNATLDELTRRIINKLTVRNVVDLTRETSELFGGAVKGATRASVLRSLSQHINCMCMLDTGPLTPILSLPFAGLIRGLQLLHGNVVGSELIESLCFALQEHLNKYNETSASNGAMVLAHLYVLNAVDSLLISSFIRSALQMKGHQGVCAAACTLTLLRACGEKLLKEAPGQMEQALTEAKSYKFQQESNVRYSTLLSYIADILTGHTRNAKRTVDEEEVPVEALLHDMATLLPAGGKPSNKRVLYRIMSTTSVLTGVTWARMMRTDKPPRWFVLGAWDDVDGNENSNVLPKTNAEAIPSADSGSEDTDDEEEDEVEIKAERIRQLRQQEKAISGQRFNTENKREVFQALTNASDDLEAFTLLIHRDPSFSRLHDTFAVLLQCAYQEKVYNPYYAQVIQRFCSAKESCKNTLQFALWDMFKLVRVESVDVTGYLNLSCLLAHLIEKGVFTLAVLRGLDLDCTNRTIGLFTRILLLRLIFQLPPARLAEVFFGGDGFRAHDVKIDTSVLRSNLSKVVDRYFVDEREAGKWIPHFYDVVARGTFFDVHRRDGPEGVGGDEGVMDDETRLQLFMKRIQVVFKALRGGIS